MAVATTVSVRVRCNHGLRGANPMSDEHPNASLVRRAYDALETRDVETLVELSRPDVVWHIPGRSPIAGEYHGRDTVLAFMAHLAALTDGTLAFELVDVWANP